VFPRPALQPGAGADLFGLPQSTPRSSGDAATFSAGPRREARWGAPAHLHTAPHTPLPAPATWLAAYDRGRRTWAAIGISYDEFEAHVRGLGHAEVPAHAADLYLAAACRLGRVTALQLFERDYIQRSRGAIQSIVRDTSAVDDILQEVRSRLVAGPTSKVACYRGTGPLGSWVRSIALNVARDHLRTEAARRRAEEAQAWSFALGSSETLLRPDSPARQVLRHGRGQASVDAVHVAFRALGPHERQLLHDHFVRGLSIDILAPLCHVNRATVARRIRRATDEVARQVRKQFGALYPREDARSLDTLALAVCRDLIEDAVGLLGMPESPEVAPGAR
jgi:RNA polymerase sigma-70 factor (ECF subfamily)